MLELKSVIKKFGAITAVNKVSFDVQPGEIFSLIGPNGSGKTTIIKMVAGLYHATQGEVLVDSMNIDKFPQKTKTIVGYIPDEPNVWPTMTGEEFLHFTGALFGMKEDECSAKIKKLLKIFDLQSKAGNFFENYSRGDKQKFTILSALLHEPKLLLIDEPIVGLDPTSAEIAKNLFVDFAKKGGSILIVTHTLPVAQEISHKIGVLAHGKLLAVGTIHELQKKAKLSGTASLGEVYNVLTDKK